LDRIGTHSCPVYCQDFTGASRTVSFEVLNLTIEFIRRHGRSARLLRTFEEQGARCAPGAHFKFWV